MARRQLLGAAALAAAVVLTAHVDPAEAQKKISVLTWNIPVYKEKIGGWIADFKQVHPDVQVEWLDKKGTEWATFYQTQVVGGAAPDIIDVQGALWLEYGANGGLVDLTPNFFVLAEAGYQAGFQIGVAHEEQFPFSVDLVQLGLGLGAHI